MRILLISIAAYKTARTAMLKTPASLSLLYLKILAKKQPGAFVEVREFFLETSVENIIGSLDGLDHDLVGFSCYVWNMKKVLELSRYLKQRYPSLKILLGGPEAGPVAEKILERNGHIDFVIRGEAEQTFVELLDTLNRQGDLNEITGLSFRSDNGTIVNNPERPLMEDLSVIPSPYLDGSIDFSNNAYLTLETSRGCPMRCRFCQWSYKKMRYFPIGRVLKEIKILCSLPELQSLYIVDSSIFYNRQRALEILDAFSVPERKFSVYFEIDMNFIDEEIIEKLAKLQGCKFSFGLQTIDPEVSRLINHRIDPDRFKNNLSLLRKKSPAARISLDLIHGLPGDNLASYKKTLDFAMSLFPDSFYLYPFILLVGSEFYRRRDEFGLEFEDEPPRWVSSSNSFPGPDREEARKLSYYIQFFYNLPMARKAMDMLWISANRLRPIGHVELYESLIVFLEEDRIDLMAAWEDVGAGGYERFHLVFKDNKEKENAFWGMFGEFIKKRSRELVSK
ncbi:MAG: radical SAM protein [Candidatus Margulisiibacteriota bacterium]|nr:B12-binding domain-containing radical SAM protein [Candidatus Margulisiibacteriota bacterium]